MKLSKGIKNCLAGIVLGTLLSSNAHADEPLNYALAKTQPKVSEINQYNSEDKIVTNMAAAGRSLLLPGWGQFYNGQNKKGTIMAVAYGAAFIGGWGAYLMADKTKREYSELGYNLPQSAYDDKFNEANNWVQWNNNLAALSYIIQSVAVFDAMTNKKESNVQTFILPTNGGVQVALNARF